MCDEVNSDLNKHLNRQDKDSNDLEFFKSDVEPLVEEISDIVQRIKEIAKGYEDIDLDDEIREMLREVGL